MRICAWRRGDIFCAVADGGVKVKPTSNLSYHLYPPRCDLPASTNLDRVCSARKAVYTALQGGSPADWTSRFNTCTTSPRTLSSDISTKPASPSEYAISTAVFAGFGATPDIANAGFAGAISRVPPTRETFVSKALL